MRLLKIFCLALIFISAPICGCERETPPQGTVARVNGENIHLHSVQALLDSRSAALGIPSSPSLSEMQKRYGQALATLIVHTLVRQDLTRRGMAISDEDVDKAIQLIKSDYTGESLENFLAEAYLREDEWRQLMRDHLAIETFTTRLLLPSIRISLDEIREYYQKHEQQFKLPDAWEICLKTASSREEVEKWCQILPPEPLIGDTVQCLTTTEKDIPAPWQKELRKIKNNSCGKIMEEDGQWRALAVLNKTAGSKRKLSEIYALIESILIDEKKNEAFNSWLEQRLAQADIKVAPGIFAHEGKEGK